MRSDRFKVQAIIPEGSISRSPPLVDPKLRKMLQDASRRVVNSGWVNSMNDVGTGS